MIPSEKKIFDPNNKKQNATQIVLFHFSSTVLRRFAVIKTISINPTTPSPTRINRILLVICFYIIAPKPDPNTILNNESWKKSSYP